MRTFRPAAPGSTSRTSGQGTPAGRITTSGAIVPSDSPAAARASTKPASTSVCSAASSSAVTGARATRRSRTAARLKPRASGLSAGPQQDMGSQSQHSLMSVSRAAAGPAVTDGLIVAGAPGSLRLRPRIKVDADGQRSRGHHPADRSVPLVRQRPRPGGGVIAGEHDSRPARHMPPALTRTLGSACTCNVVGLRPVRGDQPEASRPARFPPGYAAPARYGGRSSPAGRTRGREARAQGSADQPVACPLQRRDHTVLPRPHLPVVPRPPAAVNAEPAHAAGSRCLLGTLADSRAHRRRYGASPGRFSWRLALHPNKSSVAPGLVRPEPTAVWGQGSQCR